MSKEEEFKKSLEEILASKEFGFDESNWENARQLIDDSRRKKRLLYYVALPLLLLLLPAGAFLYFNEGAPAGMASTVKVSGQTAVEVPKEQPVEKARVAPEQAHSEPIRNKSVNAPVKEVAQPAPTGKQAPVAAPDVKPVSPEAQPQTNLPVLEQVVKEPTPSKQAVEQKTAEQPVSDHSQNNGSTGNNSTGPASALNHPDHQSENIPVTAGQAPQRAQDPAAVAIDPNTSVKTSVEEQAPVIKPVASEQLAETKTPATAAQTGSTLIPSTASATGSDSTVNLAVKPQSVTPRNYVFAEAGAAYLLGWKNPGKTDGNGINPVLGLSVANVVNKKITLSVGVYYTTVSGISYSSKVAKVTRFKLGEESDVTVITPQKAHYLIIPFRFSYSLNEDNMLGIGYNAGYLLNVDAKVETYHQGINGITNQAAYHSAGYTEGFRAFDGQAALFYRRRLAANFWAGAELFYGLTDTKDNDFFNSAVTERNSGLKLTLIYNFLQGK